MEWFVKPAPRKASGEAAPSLAARRALPHSQGMQEFAIKPNPDDPRLTEPVSGLDHEGKPVDIRVPMERPLTIYLNNQEIVTAMTIGDHPDYLAVGYLLNQHMLRADDEVTGIDYEEDIETVVVRTRRKTD
mgnify:FL=1